MAAFCLCGAEGVMLWYAKHGKTGLDPKLRDSVFRVVIGNTILTVPV